MHVWICLNGLIICPNVSAACCWAWLGCCLPLRAFALFCNCKDIFFLPFVLALILFAFEGFCFVLQLQRLFFPSICLSMKLGKEWNLTSNVFFLKKTSYGTTCARSSQHNTRKTTSDGVTCVKDQPVQHNTFFFHFFLPVPWQFRQRSWSLSLSCLAQVAPWG